MRGRTTTVRCATFGPVCGAFTLLEMVLVMFIISLVVTAVFAIVNSVTQLTNDMAVEQQRDARVHAFIELCGRTFRNLPPSAVVRLRNRVSGGGLVSQLALSGATSPLSGDPSDVIVIDADEAGDGYLRVALLAMTPAQAYAWEKGDVQTVARVPLLENVTKLEWRFLDGRSGEWASLWNENVTLLIAAHSEFPNPSQPQGLSHEVLRPGIVELQISFGTQSPQRWVFWVPPAQPINFKGS